MSRESVSMESMNDRIRKAVRVALAERDMTQADLARELGLPPQTINRAIKGQVGRPSKTWQRILDALDLELVAVPKGEPKGD